MNVETILKEYDSMFGRCELADIESFLKENIELANQKGEYGVMITLLNEIIGFCRDTTQREKALAYCDTLLRVMHQLQLQGRVEYATSLLNIANAYRAFGLCRESVDLYKKVYENYKINVSEQDFAYASLFNNWSLVYQELGEFEQAEELLLKALAVVDLYEEAVIPQANTRTNLAVTLLQIYNGKIQKNTVEEEESADGECTVQEPDVERYYTGAMRYLQEALCVYEKDGGQDFHYGGALVAMGDAYYSKKDYENAGKFYRRGMAEIEKHVGKTDNYQRVFEKYAYCRTQEDATEGVNHERKKDDTAETGNLWISNLERSRLFYQQYGISMIHGQFPQYENRIAVGLVGEGSDCFGFDDEISTDHDYELGFCMWLTESDYKAIGTELQSQYDKLILEHGNCKGYNPFLSERRGVFSVNGFYNTILGSQKDYETNPEVDWLSIRESSLATATNGEIFRDDLGTFTAVRETLLSYYPENVWRLRLAQSLHEFSQYAQSNYLRMMARKDLVTANICVGKAMESALDIAHLLNRSYAPYYKWKGKSLCLLPKLGEIIPLLEEISVLPFAANSQKEQRSGRFEEIAELILQELRSQNLVSGKDTFLEVYCQQIIKGKNMDIIEQIVDLEWKQFDKVKNEGGRAGCQDNYATFSIMRKSQYMTWNEELLISYQKDLESANEKGWNLIMEKYARMMQSTAPEKYTELEGELPVRSEQRLAIQEEIIKIQVGWMEEFAGKYPKMADNARSIHTSEDTEYNTSYETYLRGELGTYSETTFVLYGRFVAELSRTGKNLAYETMTNTAKLYGYESVEDAEKRMW